MQPTYARVLLAASVFSVSIMAGTLPGTADDDGGGGGFNFGGGFNLNGLLRGTYAFTGSAACLYAPGSADSGPAPGNTTPLANAGFNASNQPIEPSTSFSASSAVEGIRIFNGDGTGSVKGAEMGFAARPTPGPGGYPSFPPSAEASNFSYQFTYSVNPDGSWTANMVPGSYVGTFTSGPRTGQTYTTTIPQLNGLIGSFGQTLTVASLTPTVEVQIFSNGDVWPRICHRSRVLTDMDTWNQNH